MIIDSQDLIEKIIKELRTIKGEMMIAQSIHSVDDEQPPDNIEDLMKYIIKDAKASNELMKVLIFNEGKFEAFRQILKMLGVDDSNIDENE